MIKLDIANHTATITLSRKEKGNSLTPEMIDNLIGVLENIEKDVNIRVIVLTGEGKYFCSGMDLGLNNKENFLNSEKRNIFEVLKNYPKPIICKVNGPVIGGGNGILFCTDVRIMHKDAYIWFAEVKRGLVPAYISAYIVPEIGIFKAKQFMMTGEKIPAKKAYQLNFVSSVADSFEELDRLTNHYISELLTSGPEAMREIKKNILYISEHSHEESLKHVEQVFRKMISSKEAKYGMMCFMKKEKPDWTKFHSKL